MLLSNGNQCSLRRSRRGMGNSDTGDHTVIYVSGWIYLNWRIFYTRVSFQQWIIPAHWSFMSIVKKKKLYCTTKCIYCCAQTCFFLLSYNISHCFEILKIKRSTFPKCFIFNSDVLLHLSAKITINTDSLKRGRNVWDCYHNKKQWWPRCIWWALFWAPRVPFIGLGEIKLNVMIDRIFNLYQSKHDITPDCPFSGANFFLLSKRF